jgi:two-component system, OmpR family, alkaline phosphatase synthesis response regulator PhoP
MTADAVATVLVVDDDSSLRKLLAFALQRDGFQTVMSGNAADAERALREHPQIDVVVLDAMLPDADGLEVASQLISGPSTAGLPICVMSGILRRRLSSTSGVSCLVKPSPISELVLQLRELLAWRDAGGSPEAERQAAVERIRASIAG